MKRFIIFSILLLLGAAIASGQTPVPIPITGNLGDITGGPAPDAYVQLQLQNCSGGNPQITGFQGIVKTSYQYTADTNGNVNGTVWPNDLIDCNGTTGATQYLRTIVVDDVPVGQSLCYQVVSTQGVWNLATQQPISCGGTPPNPQDATYNNVNVLQNLTANNLTLTGGLKIPSLSANSMAGAGGYAPTTVSPPGSAGLQSFVAGQEGSPGGSVSAGAYACKTTNVVTGVGETTPSPASNSVTASANSALYCPAQDAAAGATCYNVYWQTGGTGQFYRGNTCVPFGKQDAQFTQPPTSSPTPPTVNTATSSIAAAQAALGGNPGTVEVPYGLVGNAGDPLTGQNIFDRNTGSIVSRFGWGNNGTPQKSITGSVMNYGWYQDSWFPDGSLSANGQQFNGLGISIQQGGTGPVYGYGLPAIASTVGIFDRLYRFGSNSNTLWGEDILTWIGNQNANAYIAEWDLYNDSSSGATSDTGGTGLALLSEGTQSTNNGIFVSGNKPWNNAFVIDDDSVNNAGLLVGKDNYYGIFNQSTSYQANNDAATSGTTSQPAPGVYWQSNVWHAGTSVSDSFALYPSYGSGTDPVRIFNFAVPDPGSSGNTTWAFNGGLVRAVYNSAFSNSGVFNADVGYQIGGTQVLAASASMPSGSYTGLWVKPSPSGISDVLYVCYLGTCTAVTVP